eukprot:1044756-Pyramimonas_sp.AAC.1
MARLGVMGEEEASPARFSRLSLVVDSVHNSARPGVEALPSDAPRTADSSTPSTSASSAVSVKIVSASASASWGS